MVWGVISLLVVVFFTVRLFASGSRIVKAERLRKKHRYKMLRDGFLCVQCEHNVRGASDRCPECGWPIGTDPS